MARFFGKIGFLTTVETDPDEHPGVWEETLVEKNYYGDLTKISRKWQNADGLNDDLVVTNQISIVADKFAYENFQTMKYVEFMGAKWKISSVEIEYPRISISLGGIYNG